MTSLIPLLIPLLFLTACGSGASTTSDEPTTITVSGTLTLHGVLKVPSVGPCIRANWENPKSCKAEADADCAGDNDSKDLAAGAEVLINDDTGRLVGAGHLNAGKLQGEYFPYKPYKSTYGCSFPFTVANVPSDGGIYSLEISGRGPAHFTEDEADSLTLSVNK